MFDPVVAHQGALRTRTRVQTQVLVVVAVAVLHDDIVGDLPTDAVPVVVARFHAADGNVATVLQKNAAGVVAVEVAGILPVAIQD